ncbi:hypothetical protein CPLU01_11069 [Colletotrichum plurivorum]|uniref:Fungal N-terminal domain-containing protein n=1 Tax=Colletotrichum plurivorum TaxID=2175906 RepID=A0A8H6N8Y5_9PEZI|nr:hypothetical protein CPLU01_11069 [Colletotrichum plurivorum]
MHLTITIDEDDLSLYTNMAEVLGVIAAMIQLAQFGDKFAKELRRFSHFSSSRAQQVKQHAAQARNFSTSISTARLSLLQHSERHPKSPVIRYISSRQVCSGLDENAEFVRDRIYEATIRTKKLMRIKSSPVLFVKWFYYKDSIFLPFAEMESLKTCLLLLMTSALLESCMAERRELPSDANEKMETLDREMLEVQDDRRTTNTNSSFSMMQSGRSAALVIKAVIQLGTSLVETGEVPEAPLVSPLSSVASLVAPTTESSQSLPQTGSLQSPLATFRMQNISLLDNQHPPNQRSRLVFDTESARSVNGYVTSSTGWKVPATAIVLDSMEDNVISMVEAHRLGIIVEPQDDGEVVTLLFNDGSHTDSVGRASLTDSFDHKANEKT